MHKYYIIIIAFILSSCDTAEIKNSAEDNFSTPEIFENKLFKISHQTGIYPKEFYLKLFKKNANHKILYTSDGSTPTLTNHILFVDSILIKESKGLKPQISYISTTVKSYEEYKSWKQPKVKPSQANEIKFIKIGRAHV